jgi:hypothetical protein
MVFWRVEADRLRVQLRRCGVVVRHAAPMPTSATGEGAVVVFLSKTQDQGAVARGVALRLPEVSRVTFAGFCPSIMYVYVATPRGHDG